MQKDQEQEQQQLGHLPALVNRKSSVALCDICFEPYHILGRWPLLACKNQHFFCDDCIEGMFKQYNNEPYPCPLCRTLIHRSYVKPHYQIFRIINSKGNINELLSYAFEHQIFEVASAFKAGKLQRISQLTKLQCNNRKIQAILHMQAFPSLVELRLDHNLIVDLSGLQGLSNLRCLNLSHNAIKDISVLQKLCRLTHLALQFNKIQEIATLLPFCNLLHWFLFGNPLKGIIIDEIFLVQFENLLTLSLSVIEKDQIKVQEVFLKGMQVVCYLPSLYRVYVKNIASKATKVEIQRGLADKVQIQWVKPQQQKSRDFSQRINTLFGQSHQYGEIFQFKPDYLSPFFVQYQINGNQIIKKSDNFVMINSLHHISKQRKVNFKFRIETTSINIVIGLCNAFLKHNPNIYSQHFIGLTFWGNIYNRGQSTALTGKLRLEDKPIVRMSIDHDQKSVKWFSDDQQVGAVHLSDQIRFSTLYFVLGMRDTDTSILLLKQ